MVPFIANTDFEWFSFLSSLAQDQGGRLDEVNFWLPKAQRTVARMQPGCPLFLRLKSPRNVIAGYGYFASFTQLTIERAWEFFGPFNGLANFERFITRIGRFRGLDLSGRGLAGALPLGCTLLRAVTYWPEDRWIPWGESEGWAPNIVQGKTERDGIRASRLLSELHFDTLSIPEDLSPEPFEPYDIDEREVVLARNRLREGQGVFRSRLLDAYGRKCAITGEHTEIVLDAAHIQPYHGPRSNHLQNGVVLTKEFHTLFDQGYVTITPEYEVRVSPRLRREWQNGKRYYAYDGRPLMVLPPSDLRPEPRVLDWHGRRVFAG